MKRELLCRKQGIITKHTETDSAFICMDCGAERREIERASPKKENEKRSVIDLLREIQKEKNYERLH